MRYLAISGEDSSYLLAECVTNPALCKIIHCAACLGSPCDDKSSHKYYLLGVRFLPGTHYCLLSTCALNRIHVGSERLSENNVH